MSLSVLSWSARPIYSVTTYTRRPGRSLSGHTEGPTQPGRQLDNAQAESWNEARTTIQVGQVRAGAVWSAGGGAGRLAVIDEAGHS